jgi:hypothetical protein
MDGADEDFLIVAARLSISPRANRCHRERAADGRRDTHQVRGESAMANYVLLYHGGGMPESPEEGAKVMEAWNAWFGQLGGALVDGGNPASKSRTIAADGAISDDASGPSGYSIIKADSLEAAVGLAKGCPVLAGGANVLVSETLPVM